MQGIIVGCDKNQEWLLPWWWEHYSACNTYPVIFIDFGMSEKGRAWCMSKGETHFLEAFDPSLFTTDHIPLKTKKEWEMLYGEKFWLARTSWFKKPFALLQSPFQRSLWLDLDCQVKGSLEPLFNTLVLGADIALAKGRQYAFLEQGELFYNTGVIAFKQNAPILQSWVKNTLQENAKFPSDEAILSHLIHREKPPFIAFPQHYNWHITDGTNPDAIITHFCGAPGKVAILKQLTENTPTESPSTHTNINQ